MLYLCDTNTYFDFSKFFLSNLLSVWKSWRGITKTFQNIVDAYKLFFKSQNQIINNKLAILYFIRNWSYSLFYQMFVGIFLLFKMWWKMSIAIGHVANFNGNNSIARMLVSISDLIQFKLFSLKLWIWIKFETWWYFLTTYVRVR